MFFLDSHSHSTSSSAHIIQFIPHKHFSSYPLHCASLEPCIRWAVSTNSFSTICITSQISFVVSILEVIFYLEWLMSLVLGDPLAQIHFLPLLSLISITSFILTILQIPLYRVLLSSLVLGEPLVQNKKRLTITEQQMLVCTYFSSSSVFS